MMTRDIEPQPQCPVQLQSITTRPRSQNSYTPHPVRKISVTECVIRWRFGRISRPRRLLGSYSSSFNTRFQSPWCSSAMFASSTFCVERCVTSCALFSQCVVFVVTYKLWYFVDLLYCGFGRDCVCLFDFKLWAVCSADEKSLGAAGDKSKCQDYYLVTACYWSHMRENPYIKGAQSNLGKDNSEKKTLF